MSATSLSEAPVLPPSALITARSGSNLALAFGCLPPERRRAMGIFYAFCRVVDDASDSSAPLEQKRAELDFWREEIRRAYVSQPLSPLGKEMAEIIRTYLIPPTPLEEILNGVEMDLTTSRYPDFKSLEQYCYRVASAVGLVSIEIFSYRQPQTREYAVALGMAFQLTNILRDVKKDAAIDRIYLPQDEMAEFGVTDADILNGRWSPKMRKFLKFQNFRARHYYAKSLRLIDPRDRPTLTAAEIMREVYETLLKKIARNDYNVFKKDIRISKPGKVLCINRANQREKKAAPLPPPPKRVLVIGGGFAGVTAALDLIERGHAVTLLEAKSFLGGRAHSFKEAKSGEVIDNGQHVLMGCYTETLRLLEDLDARGKLQVQDALEVPFVSPRGTSTLRAADLPAPFHLLWALGRYAELGWGDRLAAVQLAVRLRLGQKPKADETAATWLQRWGQPHQLTKALWEPLCLAALNQSLHGSSASLLATVLERALLASPEGSKLIVSRVGLSELLSPETELLHRWCGGAVVHGAHVQRLLFNPEGTRCLGAETLDGRSFEADQVVCAVPWNVARGLLPAGSPTAEKAAKIADSPIVSVHFWFDRPIAELPITGFLDSPLHWLFDRNRISGTPSPNGHPYVAVISGAQELNEKTPAELEALVLAELHRFLPASREAVIKHRFVYKAKGATFAATPQAEASRPEAGGPTEWTNLRLAGDWTDTGLPGTIEGAVWSGRRAAEAVDRAS